MTVDIEEDIGGCEMHDANAFGIDQNWRGYFNHVIVSIPI